MGVGEVDGPPKKKLKQAQLPFCISSAEKSGNKRKLNAESPDGGLAHKVSRIESTPRALNFNKENVKVNNVDNVVATVDLLSDSEESDVIPKPTNTTSVKDSIAKCADDKASSNVDEEGVAKEGVGNQVVKPEVDTISESKKDDDAEGKGRQVIDKDPGRNENAERGEFVVQTADGQIEVVDVFKQTEGSAQKVDKDGAAVVESQVVCVGEIESETASECKEIDLDRSSDKALESSQMAPNLDRSSGSEQGDLNSSVLVSSEDEHNVSASSAKKGTGATPVLKKAERTKLREEKLRLKKEKEEVRRQKQEEKEKKERLKEEERKKKEEEKRKKEEVKEEEKRKKEEEKKKKEEVKEEEKRKKEEEKKKKEEEKKKKEESKEEDRKKKEEARLAEERKEQLAKKAFTKFFIQNKSKSNAPKKDETDKPDESVETPKFMPFPVKTDMRLAVQVRHSINDEDKKVLSDALKASSPPGKLYLDEIKGGSRMPITGPATWPLSGEEHDVIIVESVVEEKSDHEDEATLCVKTNRRRAKLLQFHDNRRPPYWGTWGKKSSAVTPRKPFAQDKVFDYEVDSDSEWEDEEEGEDIGKEGESDKEQSDDENVGEDGYLLDNTFVPHGYLSDEEAAEEEENLNPEDQKLKLKVLKQEFEQELKAKTRLKPRLLGCVWISNDTTEVSKGSLYETLMNLRCKWDESEGPIDPTGPAIVDCTPSPSLASTKFPSTLVEQLVRLVHGSRLSHINLITEFMNSLDKEKQLSTISKRAVSLKIKDIAVKTPSMMGRAVWTVSPELCAEYNLPTLEPPSIPSPAPILDTPPPKPKETALVNFLKKASTPPGPRRRVTPTLVSPIVDLTKKPTESGNSGNSTSLTDSSKTEKSDSSKDTTFTAPLDIAEHAMAPPNTVKPVVADMAEPAMAPPNTVKPVVSDMAEADNAVKPVVATAPPGVSKTANAPATPPAAPPVRKRIKPITLSKTVSASCKTPTNPKLAPIFKHFPDTPRPTPAPPLSTVFEVDLTSDSN